MTRVIRAVIGGVKTQMLLHRFDVRSSWVRLLVAGTTFALVALVGLLGLPSAPTRAADYHPEWGSTTASNGELLRGCHSYPFSYTLTPPQGQWVAEVFITGPQGESVASLAFLQGANDLSGTETFQLCVPTTHSGAFTINVKLSVNGDGSPDHVEGFLPPTTFTLTKTKRSHHKVLTLGPVRVLHGNR